MDALAAIPPARWAAAALALFVYAAWVARVWRATRGMSAPAVADEGAIVVAHASQTGFAIELTERTADALRSAGTAVLVVPLGRLDAAALQRMQRVLFVAATYGEGDPPDVASTFARHTMGTSVPLRGLKYGVLALGDRSYARFCGFGHALDAWLHRQGAQPLFDLVEVDDGDAAALRHWQHHLGVLAGSTDLPDWSPPAYARWTLTQRECLNAGSPGAPVWRVALAPPSGESPSWRAGDIVEIGPRHAPSRVEAFLASLSLDGATRVRDDDAEVSLRDALAARSLVDVNLLRGIDAQALVDRLDPLPHREYSIASLPADGAVEILVREMRRPDGSLGIGSGWLIEHAPPGGDIALRIRANPNFRAPDEDVPLILIGNGTGIGGLRAHLKERIAAGRRRNWLLFGERTRASDRHFGDEIDAWHAAGAIAHVDLAFSRDTPGRGYVQHALAAQRDRLRAWIADGAVVLVCGSLEGMAPAVDAELRAALGDGAVDAMLADSRYRRDVY